MPPAPASLARRLAVLGGIVVLTLGTVGSASAAAPLAMKARQVRQAWDSATTRPNGRVIVTFEAGTTTAERSAAAKALGLTDGRALRGTPARAYGLGSTSMARLRSLPPGVESITPDVRLARDLDPADEPGWDYLWGLHNTGQSILGQPGTSNIDIDALQAYGISKGDPAVVVAVIDDGVDFGHPDLAARAWTNPGESGGGRESNGNDDDDNGYVDDVHGWDFCNGDNSVHDFDHDAHGTHVAGTIAASLDGQGVVGVAPQVSIMALKFIDDDPDKECGLTSQAIEAIEYAKHFGVVISNNSYGMRGQAEDFEPLRDAIETSGMLYVTSAGNDGIDNDTDGSPAFPASFDLPNVVTVAAADKDGGLADFSNYGQTTVDISAPGVHILSSVPIDSDNPEPELQWEWMNGTSMAAPHVTGVAALLASQNPSFRVTAGVNGLRSRLLTASKALPLSVGDTVTGRMIDARFALDTVAPTPQAPNSHAFSVGSTLGTTTVNTIVGWPAATDDASGVRNYTVEQQVNAGPWTTAIAGTTARTTTRALAFNASNRFRVKSLDRAGNLSGFVTGPVVLPKLYQETTSLATYTGTWSTVGYSPASGGRERYATRAGAAVSFRFTGRAVAVIAPKGATRGSARVYVDNVYAGAISLYRSSTLNRVVVFGRSWTSSGTHTVKLVLVGTAGRPRVDIDAFAILR